MVKRVSSCFPKRDHSATETEPYCAALVNIDTKYTNFIKGVWALFKGRRILPDGYSSESCRLHHEPDYPVKK